MGDTMIQKLEIKFVLISRRRHLRAGARFHCRGLDDDGNVANFVETELLVQIQREFYSILQVRGSVPIFWSQKGRRVLINIKGGLTAKIQQSRSTEISFPAFEKHIKDLISCYDTVLMINLLSKDKGSEKILTQAFQTNIKNYLFQCQSKKIPNRIKYEYFDFHGTCKTHVSSKTNLNF